MPLSDAAIRQTKPTEKPFKLSDGDGMFLLVNPNGSKYWRLKFRYAGKEKILALGVYPDVPLKLAREKRDEARRLLADGVDPSEFRKAIKTMKADRAANSFEVVAREWFAKYSPGWAPAHSIKIIQRLERDVFPWIGGRPISDITAPEMLACLRRIEERGTIDTAHRAKQNCGQVFRYGIATGRAEHDVCADLKGAIPPPQEGHFPAITDPTALVPVLKGIDAYPGHLVVKCALKLLPLVFVRPGELRMAEWVEFDLDRAEWCIPLERMKTKQPHIVPLSTQAIAILRELHPLTGDGRFVFPGARNQGVPMSNMATSVALKSLGFAGEMSAHGFRATARTLLDEVLGYRPELVEHQLAHAVRDPLGRAYNRTTHLPERRKMMQAWADYLDGLKAGSAEILPFQRQL
ncbi:MAG: integrase arm-type DNA-binding domain-containing protein [Magnetococcales bacterium]|nr:integrase arm-type DNA-binding domain-containing protein [Magnetococcales bacterium]NGZ28701.1 integrase arm-type DNA-binding domain-containing protein [Magnetococcales bacterium]